MSYHLAKNIKATLTYYDVLDMPLTSFEIWKHLILQDIEQTGKHGVQSIGDVVKILSSGELDTIIQEHNGFYFLKGRKALVRKRIQAEKISVGKLRRMHRLVRILRFLPYVRMLAATGSLAMKNGTRESDWDMFVVLRSGKIWIGRTLLTGFLHLIGKRRHGRKIQDRACLNYFVTEDNLEIGTKDLFSAHEYRFLIPMYNERLFQKFELKNRWIAEYRPHFSLTAIPHLLMAKDISQRKKVQDFLEKIFDGLHLEVWLASWQGEKIRRNPKTSIEGSLIKADDHSLIFLPHPQGPRVFEKYKERLSV
ncbi:MAG: hypothetical protein COZ27_00565 [Candidatus Moranbacteria bacterium CG_4_10_14_3_um_filter_41_65]|nr:MAG: hypothetical protein COX32_01845 [Candidatus Moranbacteria bacterium CG23_combo_of_CG06-09_8_20_14_all_41_28]PIV86012.1 MAG: hypothetical protein COW50_03890 [Candidatus Moranbacteria bacterium CG17_big_fil_post_rev_8_21_14_2_50_41_107]PIW94109.1 MAG: hypothetical protein COZ86_02800 [Candidatus Moranbacteria bacterium CG_4_8_14_3_um_filter_41_13]PIX91862.1 MAG: hypothetical protein COZ27_00565 [Candidatus Moranbacteria bacterium CG_4_10_14_3_um_filter_41_65]PJC00424.1 MAG: hypothetical